MGKIDNNTLTELTKKELAKEENNPFALLKEQAVAAAKKIVSTRAEVIKGLLQRQKEQEDYFKHDRPNTQIFDGEGKLLVEGWSVASTRQRATWQRIITLCGQALLLAQEADSSDDAAWLVINQAYNGYWDTFEESLKKLRTK